MCRGFNPYVRKRGALRHDDRIDVVAMGVASWLESMAKDENESHKTYLDDLWKKEMDNHMKHLVNPLKQRGNRGSGRSDHMKISMRS